MKLFQKNLGDYIAFTWWTFYVLFLVAVFRILFSFTGMPYQYGNLFSSLTWAAIILMALIGRRAALRQFGGYRQIWGLAFVVSAFTQFLISVGILLFPLYGWATYFHNPDGLPNHPEKVWVHMLGHWVFGLTVGVLVLTGIGALSFWLTSRSRQPVTAPAAGESETESAAESDSPPDSDKPAA